MSPQPQDPPDPYWESYAGLYRPNYTMVPNQVLDELVPRLTEAETKVVLILCRASFGYQTSNAVLSLSDLAARTGLHRRSIMRAVASLEAYGIITVNRERTGPATNAVNLYTLRILSGAEEHALWLRHNRPPTQTAMNPDELWPDDEDPR